MKIKWNNCFKVGITVFLLYLAVYYWPSVGGFMELIISASMPLIIGAAMAYVINLLMVYYELRFFPKSKSKKLAKARRPICLTLAVFTLFALVALIISLIIPELVSCIALLLEQIPKGFDKGLDILEGWNILPEDIMKTLSSIDWQSKVGEIVNVVTSGVGNVIDVVFKTLSSVFSGIVTTLLAIIFAIYILLGKDKLKNQFGRIIDRYISKAWHEKISYVFDVLNQSFKSYIIGQCTEAVILGVLCSLGMFILKLPYAAMIGALIAFTALVPIAGAYIGGGIGAFLILMVSPTKALVFLIFLILLQQFEGNVIYPKVVGSSIGLPGIWVLAAVTIGGGLNGVIGMLLGVPIAAALYKLIRDDVNKPRKEEVKKSEEKC